MKRGHRGISNTVIEFSGINRTGKQGICMAYIDIDEHESTGCKHEEEMSRLKLGYELECIWSKSAFHESELLALSLMLLVRKV